MKKSIQFMLVGLALCIPVLTQAARPVFLIKPLTRAPVILYTGQTATATYQITNNTPFTLNGNGLVNLPQGIIQSGGSCPQHFNLASGASCTVNLQIVADALLSDVSAGPEVCHTPAHRIYCSLPDSSDELRIIKGATGPAMLSINPSVLTLTEGGPAQTVTVSNSSLVDANNLQVTIPSGSGVTLDTSHTTCTTTLPAGSSCQYSFLPGQQTESNSLITIRDSNTANTVVLSTNVRTITIGLSSSVLGFPVGTTGSMTISNTSTTTALTDLQVSIPIGSQLSIDTASTCTIGGTIPASGSCTLVFTTPANVAAEIGTVVVIQGSNTNAAEVRVSATSTTLVVTSPTTVQTLTVDGSTTLSFTVKNTGTSDAANVQLNSPWTGVTISPATCGSIPAGSSCTFTIKSATPNLAGRITIQGSDTNATTTPYVAFLYEGGLVFSLSGTTGKVVTVSNNSNSIKWFNGSFTSIPGAQSYTNGATNTAAIHTSQGLGTYAAITCIQYTGDGYTDWYLPAICELSSNGNSCAVGNNIYDSLFVFGFLTGLTNPAYYWSSTQDNSVLTWYQPFVSSGNSAQGTTTPASTIAVRCVRSFSY